LIDTNKKIRRLEMIKHIIIIILFSAVVITTVYAGETRNIVLEIGSFKDFTYVNSSLGFSIDLPAWKSVRKFKKNIAQEEDIDYDFGYMNLFLFSKYPQLPGIPDNPEMNMAVHQAKDQSLKSHIEKQNYANIKKGKITGKDIYTIQRLIQPKDHQTGKPLDHLAPIHLKFIVFKKNGLIGEIGILYRNTEQEKELNNILGTIQLK
jgi:hypothetical protein